MEKIININFQGRVIPIEETAYNTLKEYTESLRHHFAAEESSDEIINDIENRIAELLSYRIKQGAACITVNDLKGVIDSIGKLEDIAAAEGEERVPPKSTAATPPIPDAAPGIRGRFYRNADDKVIAGLCSAIANRMGIDPVIVRVLFVLLFGGLFWLYIIMWIVVPSQSVSANVTRRLYRNPGDKVIAGVCGGLAVYFRTQASVVRLIFALPLIIGILSRGSMLFWWHWHWWGLGPRIFMGSIGSTFFIMYVVLWIALPYARSATDILEMRGEKIDLNSIKATNQEKTIIPPPRSSGLGHVIGIVLKAILLFIAGSIALGLFGGLIGLVVGGFAIMPFTHLVIDGWWQALLLWCSIVLFAGIPLLAMATWLVRRLMGVRSHRHYLAYVFITLWVAGLISLVILSGTLIGDFSTRASQEEACSIAQPTGSKLYINVADRDRPDNNRGQWNIYRTVSSDSFWLNTVRVNIAQSKDSLYHMYETKVSRGASVADARSLASHITFPFSQQDSVITLPGGFSISTKDKFRNQQAIVTIEVPVGKEVKLSDDVDSYCWFNIDGNGSSIRYSTGRYWHRLHIHHADEDNVDAGEYRMTSSGVKKTDDTNNNDKDDDDNDD